MTSSADLWRRISCAIVVGVLCNAPRAAGADVLIDGYRLVAGPIAIAEIPDDLSGVTFVPESGTLLVVDNGTPRVSELDRDGRFRRHIELAGFEDVEDLVYLGGGRLVLIEERRRTLSEHVFTPETVRLERGETVLVDAEVSGNNGIEGVTYHPATDRLIVVKERLPRRIYGITRARAAGAPPAIAPLWDIEAQAFGLSDLSAVCVDPRTGHLLLLSDESRMIVECTVDGVEVGRLSLSAGSAGLAQDLVQPEGIALDDAGRLYIVAEPNLLHIFARP